MFCESGRLIPAKDFILLRTIADQVYQWMSELDADCMFLYFLSPFIWTSTSILDAVSGQQNLARDIRTKWHPGINSLIGRTLFNFVINFDQ